MKERNDVEVWALLLVKPNIANWLSLSWLPPSIDFPVNFDRQKSSKDHCCPVWHHTLHRQFSVQWGMDRVFSGNWRELWINCNKSVFQLFFYCNKSVSIFLKLQQVRKKIFFIATSLLKFFFYCNKSVLIFLCICFAIMVIIVVIFQDQQLSPSGMAVTSKVTESTTSGEATLTEENLPITRKDTPTRKNGLAYTTTQQVCVYL